MCDCLWTQLNVLFDKKRQKLHEALEQYQQRCGRLLQQNEDTLGAALRAHREVRVRCARVKTMTKSVVPLEL